jgi:hypothetical protein
VLWAGWAAVATGAVLCVIGWYGVSGERFAERQIPYLASCTIPGASLIIAGAVLLAHGRQALAAARVEQLYGLLVAAGTEPAEPPPGRPGAEPDWRPTSGELLMVPGGTLLHRADCPLVSGKPEAVTADARVLAGADLDPCPICEPDRPAPPPGPPGSPEPGPGPGPGPGEPGGPGHDTPPSGEARGSSDPAPDEPGPPSSALGPGSSGAGPEA